MGDIMFIEKACKHVYTYQILFNQTSAPPTTTCPSSCSCTVNSRFLCLLFWHHQFQPQTSALLSSLSLFRWQAAMINFDKMPIVYKGSHVSSVIELQPLGYIICSCVFPAIICLFITCLPALPHWDNHWKMNVSGTNRKLLEQQMPPNSDSVSTLNPY